MIVYSEPLVVCVCVCTASAHFLLIGVQPVTGELRIDLPISKTKRRKINKYKKKKRGGKNTPLHILLPPPTTTTTTSRVPLLELFFPTRTSFLFPFFFLFYSTCWTCFKNRNLILFSYFFFFFHLSFFLKRYIYKFLCVCVQSRSLLIALKTFMNWFFFFSFCMAEEGKSFQPFFLGGHPLWMDAVS